jgi:cytidine deaminase
MCAERVAIFKAISSGKKKFAKICVVADTDALTPPCGACRQIIWEFCGDVEVLMANLHGKEETFQMSELLPKAFDASFLDTK